MLKIIKIIIKNLRKIGKLSISSIFKIIIDLLSGKNIIHSLFKLFKWISLLFTFIYMINDTLATNIYKEMFNNINIIDNIKYYWNKIIELILKIFRYFKFNNSEDIPEPKMLNNIDSINNDKDLLNYKDVKYIIQDKYGNTYNDNWSWYFKMLFILGLIVGGVLIVTIIGNNVIDIIKVPFIWINDHLFSPVTAFFGIIYTILKWFFRGGGDPDSLGNQIRDNYGVNIFHSRTNLENNPNIEIIDNSSTDENIGFNRKDKGKGVDKLVRFTDIDQVINDPSSSKLNIPKDDSSKLSPLLDSKVLDKFHEESPILDSKVLNKKNYYEDSSVDTSSILEDSSNAIETPIGNPLLSNLTNFSKSRLKKVNVDEISDRSDATLLSKVDKNKETSNPLLNALKKSNLLSKKQVIDNENTFMSEMESRRNSLNSEYSEIEANKDWENDNNDINDLFDHPDLSNDSELLDMRADLSDLYNDKFINKNKLDTSINYFNNDTNDNNKEIFNKFKNDYEKSEQDIENIYNKIRNHIKTNHPNHLKIVTHKIINRTLPHVIKKYVGNESSFFDIFDPWN